MATLATRVVPYTPLVGQSTDQFVKFVLCPADLSAATYSVPNMPAEIDWTSLLAGSGLVVIGSSIAGLYSFAGQVLTVFVGFCLFVLGYFLARDGWVILSPVEHPIRDAEASLHADHPMVRSAVGLVGIYGIAAGVTQFSLTVIDPNVISAVRAGVYSVGGYAWTHVVIHQSLF